jgi:hypothetical protein
MRRGAYQFRRRRSFSHDCFDHFEIDFFIAWRRWAETRAPLKTRYLCQIFSSLGHHLFETIVAHAATG